MILAAVLEGGIVGREGDAIERAFGRRGLAGEPIVPALSRAGFELPEEAVRLRLVDAGQAAALSVDLPGRGDDPVAATARSGERKPVSPALTVGAALEVYLWETVAWTALGLALAASLWVGPLLRRRFVSDR